MFLKLSGCGIFSKPRKAEKLPSKANPCSVCVEQGLCNVDNGLECPKARSTIKHLAVDPLAWLADVLARIAGIPQGRLCELLPWNWNAHVRSVAPPQAA